MMKEKIAGISVLVNLALAVGKISVGFAANSAAILAEGAHSAVDILSSCIGFMGIIKSKKPGDKEHPYGHYKFEAIAGLAITLILLATGAAIIYEACCGFLNPGRVEMSYLALGVMIVSAIANEIMSVIKIHFGKRENSIALISDGFHSKIDVYTSIAVLFGLVLTKYWVYADPILAMLIGAFIVKQSLSMGKSATDSLLDVSAGEETEDKIRATAREQKIEISDMKTQKRGPAITANLEITLPNKLSVEEAAGISNNLRKRLIESIGNLVYVSIQIKGHDVSTGFYKPKHWNGFGWQKHFGAGGGVEKSMSLGPGGQCECSKCGYSEPHQRGVPCHQKKCPRCGSLMKRK